MLGNLKTAISGAHKVFKFSVYIRSYLGACRFNRRFDLPTLLRGLIGRATASAIYERATNLG